MTVGQPIVPIRKGESLPFKFNRGDESIDGWICTIKVKQFAPDTALIDRVVEETDDAWEGFLTSIETDALTAGITYRLMGILTNSTTGEEEQPLTRFSITADWGA